jgi:K(+)-stimulated pyrophosphate-energized sodium pump
MSPIQAVAHRGRFARRGYRSLRCATPLPQRASAHLQSVCCEENRQIMNSQIAISSIVAILGLVYVALTARRVLSHDEGNAEMKRIGAAIREGAQAFLRAEYRVLIVFALAVTVVLFAGLQNIYTALAYLVGAFTSALTGFIGMSIATRSNTRTAAAAMKSLDAGLRVAFGAGSVMGMSVVSVGLLGLSLFFLVLGPEVAVNALTGYSFGASSIALFARVGGGIYTKAADVGADLVGKVEAGIPEDDPRNPAVIADNVGDNVGDVAGMGADLYESYVGSIVAASAVAVSTTNKSLEWEVLPFLIAAIGLVASLIGSFMVRTKEGATQEELLKTLRTAVWTASGLAILGFAALFAILPNLGWPIFGAIVVGLLAGLGISYFTEYYTSYTEKPTKGIADSAQTGPATVIISGLAVGMQSTFAPVLIVSVSVIVAFMLGQMANAEIGGLYAVAIAGVGMLATLGITLATDAYGPVADNSGGVAEMAHLPKEVRVRTDALDSLGNTTAATGKGFAIGSAVLTALGLLAAYSQAAKLQPSQLSVLDPKLLAAVFFGAMLPFLFSAMTMTAVGRAAMEIVQEVRRQFREIKGLMEGTAQADYATCVSISTKSALREMVLPGVMAVVAPLFIGFLLGPGPLAGMLVGATACGFVLAVMMANAGGAWDNAKKYIETGEHGGKGSNAHKAAVVGDTVGDPFKDTSGPSLNILIKLMTVVSLVFAPLLAQVGGIIR